MKKIITYLYLILNTGIIFSQVRTDTTITVDSVYRNDTLFIYYTKHITHFFIDTNTYYKQLQRNIFTNLSRPHSEITPISIPLRKNFISIKFQNTFRIAYNFYLPNKNEYNFFKQNFALTEGTQSIFRHKNYLFTTGLLFESDLFPDDFYKSWDELYEKNIQYIWHRQKLNIDTIWYLNIDSLIIGDTVYEYFLDTTVVNWQDTTIQTTTDTLQYSFEGERLNHLHHLTIPLSIGYVWQAGKRIDLNFNTGFVFYFLIYSDYQIFDYQQRAYSPVIASKFHFTGYTDIGINYALIPQKFYLSANLQFTYAFSPMLRNYSTPPAFNFSLGISQKF